MAKYQVIREVYLMGGMKASKFTAKNNVEAIIKVLDNCGYGWGDEEGRMLGEQGFTMPTFEEVLNELERTNGDGMDFIFSIKNLDNGKILFENADGFYQNEEW